MERKVERFWFGRRLVVARCARRRRVVGEVARREMSQHSERERRGTRTERERGRGEREPGELLTSSLTEIFQFLLDVFIFI